jgi:hypothetical protein
MMSVETSTLLAYFFVLSVLGLYGWHRYFIVYLYAKHKDQVPGPPPAVDEWPIVTVQLPVYNEMYVVDRLIAFLLLIIFFSIMRKDSFD